MTIRKIADSVNRWRAYRNTYSALSALGHRELDDLGIQPGDIRSIARKAGR